MPFGSKDLLGLNELRTQKGIRCDRNNRRYSDFGHSQIKKTFDEIPTHMQVIVLD